MPRTVLALCVLIGVAACSPYRFASQVGDFADGVTTLSDGLANGDGALARDQAVLDRLERAGTRPVLRFTPGCNAPTADDPPCGILGTAAADALKSTVSPTQAASKLREYAAGLRAVTNAKDRADLDGAAAKLAGAVKGLTSTLPAAAPVPVVISTALWLVGAALDAERLAALKRAVPAADPHVATLARLLGAALQTRKDQRVHVLHDTANLLARGMTARLARDDYLARYDQLTERLATLDTVLRLKPAASVASLVAAHHTLREAVENPSVDLATLQDSVAAFAAQAGALRDAFAPPAKK